METKIKQKLEADKIELRNVLGSLKDLNVTKQLLNNKALELQGSIKTLQVILSTSKTENYPDEKKL